MTEEAQAAAAEKEVNKAADEAAVSSQEQGGQEQSRDFEAEAKEIGWVPETEFKGPKDKWKPAQQFVEDGERILPIVQSQLRREREEREKEKADFQKRLDRLDRTTKSSIERLKKQHQAEIDRIQQQKLAAVEAGDTTEYRRLDQQEKALVDTKFDAPEEAEDQSAVQSEWMARNQWYSTDFDKADEATRYSQWIAQKNPSITLKDNLAQTEAHMREKYPELYGGQKRLAANGHAAVDGGGSFAAAPRKEGIAAKLPPEARAQAEKDVKDGLYKSVDEWSKVYFG